ncbi:MAG: sterol desaturase family protein [Actinobacteria bacterium]|nr:sterol desaturase family protein [Actinomycetota bacterium]
MQRRQIAATTLGWVLWTGTEYAMHRGAFHFRPTRSRSTLGGRARQALIRLVAAEHRSHHREPLRTSLFLRLLGHVAVAAVSSGVPVMVRHRDAWAGWVGFTVGYSVYETVHWRIHHCPGTVNDARVEHHRVHHEEATRSNFGVTVPWWDHAFGTVAVARRRPDLSPGVLVD